jgi:hypothetical protein
MGPPTARQRVTRWCSSPRPLGFVRNASLGEAASTSWPHESDRQPHRAVIFQEVADADALDIFEGLIGQPDGIKLGRCTTGHLIGPAARSHETSLGTTVPDSPPQPATAAS